MTNEIVKKSEDMPTAQDSSPIGIMQMVLSQGGDLQQFEKMMELQERWEANEAKKAYHQAMAAFKAEPLKIMKDKKVDFKSKNGRTSYSHASLGNATEKINAGLGKHGLSAAWKLDQTNGIKITCIITHKLGYSESTSLTGPADTSGTKNSIQAMGSTISYLERYTLLALTGLATHDQDNDGQTSTENPPQPIAESQIIQIEELLESSQTDINHFLNHFKIKSIGELQAQAVPRIIADLTAIKDGLK